MGVAPDIMEQSSAWAVEFTGKAKKQKEKLPPGIKAHLILLVQELSEEGPEQPEWFHFGPIRGKGKNDDYFHCHLNKGRPAYVAVWKVIDHMEKIMEVRYVGTHENANYRRIV